MKNYSNYFKAKLYLLSELASYYVLLHIVAVGGIQKRSSICITSSITLCVPLQFNTERRRITPIFRVFLVSTIRKFR